MNNKVYELIDISNGEVYQSLGIFSTKDNAKNWILDALDKHTSFSEIGAYDELSETFEIKIRVLNCYDDGGGKPICTINRNYNFDEDIWITDVKE